MADKENLKTSIGWLEMYNYTSAPDLDLDTTRRGLAFVGGTLKYYNGSTFVTISGSGGVSSWDEMYDNDQLLTIDGASLQFNLTHATNAGLTLSAAGGAAGHVLQITNSGTGKDVNGTSSTWSVTKLGAAVFSQVDLGDDQKIRFGASQNGTIQWVLASSYLEIAGNTAFAASTTVTVLGLAGSDVFTVTAGDLVVTDGSLILTDADNAATFSVVNNTASTAAAVVSVTANDITSGTILKLITTDAGLTTGFYVQISDGSDVFTIGDEGATVIGGVGASNVLTLTAGDMLMSDGSITVTDADNAASLSVTNDTATTANVFNFAGSGVFSGVTTSSFFKIVASGLTTGTAVYIAAAAATTSVAVVDIPVAGLTSGSALRITSATANFTTGGKLIELSSTAAVAGNLLTATTTGAYTGTGMILVTAGAATTGVLVSVISTTGLTSGSLIRATSSTAGAIATNGAISFSATGNFTSTARIGFLNVAANTTTGGTVAHISATALTDGTILSLEAVEATLTTGLYIQCYDGAANDFTVAKYGATVIAGNALGTAALTLTKGDILVSDGNLTVTGKIIFNATETIAGGGTTTALNLAKSLHYIDSDAGGDIFTLADGVAGQITTILLTSSTGVATITPANLAGGTSVTLNADGDSVVLQFMDTEWFIIGGNSYAVV